MTFRCLKLDQRRAYAADWDDWLSEADLLYSRFFDWLDQSPFDFHEVAAVGFLAAAASRADFITLNEYEITKRDQWDRRFKVRGRADLWMARNNKTYSFEFKRAWYAATMRNLTETLSRARKDIDVVDLDESHHAAGVSLAYVRDEARIERYESFANQNDVHAAYHIGPEGAGGGYLYFSVKGQ